MIDTPGIYSLTCYTIEEKVTRKCLEDGEVDVIVNVVDASSLERNLYLTLQLLELKKPVILALNMMDIVEERGVESLLRGDARAVLPRSGAGAHQGLAGIAHHGGDVGEVHVDGAAAQDHRGDAADRVVEHVVGEAEGVDRGDGNRHTRATSQKRIFSNFTKKHFKLL
jgi:hypothetical protein